MDSHYSIDSETASAVWQSLWERVDIYVWNLEDLEDCDHCDCEWDGEGNGDGYADSHCEPVPYDSMSVVHCAAGDSDWNSFATLLVLHRHFVTGRGGLEFAVAD